nr:MAG TPA: hypothetical protein [Caudoviricetes sp.]
MTTGPRHDLPHWINPRKAIHGSTRYLTASMSP